MKKFGELLQSADWKTEKHEPVIECPDSVKAGEKVQIKVSVGKEIPHPNTTEHHIQWIQLFFKPEGEKFPYQLANNEFWAHGATTQGPNTGSAWSDPFVTGTFTLKSSGTLMALSYCNIHGLWEGAKEISIS